MSTRRTPDRRPARTALRLFAGSLVLCAGSATSAQAGISSTSGSISVISHPTGTLTQGTLESSTSIYAWFERTIVSPGSQSLDHVGSGQVSQAIGLNTPSPGTVTRDVMDSYLVHFDPTGTSGVSAQGSITFDRPIIGVWFTTSGLNGSDSTWAPSGLSYGSPTSTSGSISSRGLELGNGSTSDRFSISSDLRTLTILNVYAINNSSGVDHLRVLVNPEPSSIALLGMGLLGLGSLVVRRRRRARS